MEESTRRPSVTEDGIRRSSITGEGFRRISLTGAEDDRPVVKEAVVLGTSIPGLERHVGQRRISWSSLSSPMTTPLNKVVQQSPLSIPSIAQSRAGPTPTMAGGLSSTAAGGLSTTGGTATNRRRLSFEVPPTPESAYYGGGMPGSKYGFGTIMTQAIQSVSEEPPLETEVAPPVVIPTPAKVEDKPTNVMTGATAPAVFPAVAPGTFMPGMYPFPQPFQMPAGYPFMMPMQGMLPIPQQVMPARPPGTILPTAYTNPPMATSATGSSSRKIELGSLLGSSDKITTLMLRNIPLKYNRESLLDEINSRGFSNTYDFFYLPIDFHTGNNMGYAFINFMDESVAKRFRATYNGVQLSADSAKICEVGEAKAQGKMKNVEQYRNSSVMSMEDRYQPVVFENGVRQPFPAPTRSLKPVKPRPRTAT